LSHEAAADSLPLQDAFSVLFFVAVGMLFDPAILVRQPIEVLSVVLIIMVGKSLGAFFIVLVFRYPLRTALTISASLAQIGEFSFILAALAVSLNLLPPEGQSLIVAGALLSISLNPLAFAGADRIARWLGERPRLLTMLERPAGPIAELPPTVDEAALRGHAIIVGYGRVGSAIGETLTRVGMPYVIIEQNRETAEALRAKGLPVLYGDATRPGVLREAHVDQARLLIVATPDPFQSRAMIDLAREANPKIDTVARTHSENERDYLERHGVGLALIGERELALGMAHYALLRMGCEEKRADATVDAIRRQPRPRTESLG
jgi:CPA2 family monovalent cation:H+ antiporter-2